MQHKDEPRYLEMVTRWYHAAIRVIQVGMWAFLQHITTVRVFLFCIIHCDDLN